MPGVAAAAAAEAAVWIFPAHPDIGPHTRQRFTIGDLHHGAVTGITSGRALDGVVHAVIEPAIDLPHDLQGMGVFAPFVLFCFVGVASAAILGCYHRRDGLGVVLQVGCAEEVIFLIRLVTLVAMHVHLCMNAPLPVMVDPRRYLLMACNTGAA